MKTIYKNKEKLLPGDLKTAIYLDGKLNLMTVKKKSRLFILKMARHGYARNKLTIN